MADDRYLDPYRRSAKRHGSAFEVTLWASPQTQRRRFAVFCEMAFLPGKRILDAGCSRGDMAAYLLERGIEYERFIGIDALEDVIAYARTRGLPRTEFIAGDMIANPKLLASGDPQIVCISGSLNTMTDRQVLVVLEAAWQATGETLLFNFLSDRCGRRAPAQTGPARRLNTMNLLDWAFGKTPEVAYRQDYLGDGHDGTIMMART